eukprot:Nk52_evm1s488 gene=Nk52_evmTU1s488
MISISNHLWRLVDPKALYTSAAQEMMGQWKPLFDDAAKGILDFGVFSWDDSTLKSKLALRFEKEFSEHVSGKDPRSSLSKVVPKQWGAKDILSKWKNDDTLISDANGKGLSRNRIISDFKKRKSAALSELRSFAKMKKLKDFSDETLTRYLEATSTDPSWSGQKDPTLFQDEPDLKDFHEALMESLKGNGPKSLKTRFLKICQEFSDAVDEFNGRYSDLVQATRERYSDAFDYDYGSSKAANDLAGRVYQGLKADTEQNDIRKYATGQLDAQPIAEAFDTDVVFTTRKVQRMGYSTALKEYGIDQSYLTDLHNGRYAMKMRLETPQYIDHLHRDA